MNTVRIYHDLAAARTLKVKICNNFVFEKFHLQLMDLLAITVTRNAVKRRIANHSFLFLSPFDVIFDNFNS